MLHIKINFRRVPMGFCYFLSNVLVVIFVNSENSIDFFYCICSLKKTTASEMNMASLVFIVLTLLVYTSFLVSSDETTASSTKEEPILGKHKTSSPITETTLEETTESTFTRQQTLRGCTNSTGNSALIMQLKNEAYKYLISMIVTIFFV